MTCNSALILAAGRGERLKPITNNTPKPLIKVGEYRLIEYHIQNLARCGYQNIYINRAHLAEKFDQLLDLNQYPNLNIKYLDEPEGALETAGAINNAFNLTNCEQLLVVNGDVWCDFDFNQIKPLPADASDNGHIVLVANPEHNPQGDFSLNNGRLTRKNNQLSYTFSGIGLYQRRLFAGKDVRREKLAPILLEQIDQNRISASLHTGQWLDVGTIERLELLRSQLEKSH